MLGARSLRFASALLLLGSMGCSSSSSPGTTPANDAAGDDASAPDGSSTTDAAASDAADASDSETRAACPPASCTVADEACLALVDQSSGTRLGFRMSQLAIKKPTALASGPVGSVIAASALPNLAACAVGGAQTFNWLMQFDTTAGTLKTGGAKPVADATQGFAFDDEVRGVGSTMLHVQPTTYMATGARGAAFGPTPGGDLVLPIFLDAAATSAIVLPIKQARLSGTLSASGDCIGSYAAGALDPSTCQADATHPYFENGGSVDGYVTLEDADTIVVSAVSQSLCVLLSGDAATYGTQQNGTTVCKRDASNRILYKGDWCSATNMAADASCADAVRLALDYAASAVKITN